MDNDELIDCVMFDWWIEGLNDGGELEDDEIFGLKDDNGDDDTSDDDDDDDDDGIDGGIDDTVVVGQHDRSMLGDEE